MNKILSLLLLITSISMADFIEYKVKNEQIFINPHEIITVDKPFQIFFEITKEDFESMITDRLNILANEIKEQKIQNINHKEFRKIAKEIVKKTYLVINFNTNKDVIATHLELDKNLYKIVIDMPISINNIDENFLSPFIYNVTFYDFDKIILNELLIHKKQ